MRKHFLVMANKSLLHKAKSVFLQHFSLHLSLQASLFLPKRPKAFLEKSSSTTTSIPSPTKPICHPALILSLFTSLHLQDFLHIFTFFPLETFFCSIFPLLLLYIVQKIGAEKTLVKNSLLKKRSLGKRILYGGGLAFSYGKKLGWVCKLQLSKWWV